MKHKLLFLISIAFLFILPSVFGETIYVGEEETYSSIQNAVDDSKSGDTVIVKDGVYTEHVNIQKSITLKSENGYTSTTLVSPRPSNSVILIQSEKVIIEGFTIYGSHDDYALEIWGGKNCIVRNNRFGLDESHHNQRGIHLGADYSIITNNIFQSNTDNCIDVSNGDYCTIISNIFIRSKLAIQLDCSIQNFIYRNTFINSQIPIDIERKFPSDLIYNGNCYSHKESSIYFHSPFEITYTWNSSEYKSYLGNYYSVFPSSISDSDIDTNGIIDGFYPMPYHFPNDAYPLLSKPSEYKTRAYFPQSNNNLSETLDYTYPEKIAFKKESTVLWVNNTPFEETTTYTNEDHWVGYLSFYPDFDKGDRIQIEVGYSTTGSDFVPIIFKSVFFKSKASNLTFYLDKQQVTIQSGHSLAFQLTNKSSQNYSIHTGSPASYITPPLSHTSPPVIYDVSPTKGSVNGGTVITIKGLNFGDQQGSVFFDNQPANTIESWSYTQIVCTSPVHETGFSTIRVEDKQELSGEDYYAYYFQEESMYVGLDKHFQSIQQAVKFAESGDKITVFPGIYNENIDVNQTLHLQSKSGADATTIVGKEIIVYVSADNSTIQGFTIYGSANSSTGVLVDADKCKIIENRFGVSAQKKNDIGLASTNFYGNNTGSKTLILNNIISMNNTGIKLHANLCTIADNTFFYNNKGIDARNESNTIFNNSFIDNVEQTSSSSRVQNAWQSPIPIFYKYKGQTFINYMGNYYNNHNLFDTDMDGITDKNYLLPWTEPEDEYPLTLPIDQYSFFLFSLNSNSEINVFDEMQTEESVKFIYGGSRMWTMQSENDLEQLLSQQTVVYGNLNFSLVPEEGDKFRVYIGLTTGGNNFEPKGTAEIVADGKNTQLFYQIPTMSMDFDSGKKLAFRIKNINVDNCWLITGALKSCFSIAPLHVNHVALNVYPNQGSPTGSTEVFITGVNFGDVQGSSQILFGDTPVSAYKSWSNTGIVCKAPAHEKGWVNVSIKRDGLIQAIQQTTFLYKNDAICVGDAQMFSNIQRAINHAKPFETIIVNSGEYNENIVINKPVILQSESGFSSTTLIAKNSDFNVVGIYHEETTIDGFTIIGATNASAIYINTANAVIRNNQCGTSTDEKNNTGIYINDDSHNNIIENNIVSNNSSSGIFVEGPYNLISNNTSYKNNKGISIERSNNTVVSNKCHENTQSGIYIGYGTYNSVLYNDCRNNEDGIKISGSRNIIHASQCFYNKNSGVFSDDRGERNIFSKNIFSKNICKSNKKYGIKLNNSNNILFLNQFQANGLDVIKNTYVSEQTNQWYSRVPLNYIYKGTLQFNKIGNYYDDHISWDINNDGIVNEEYIIPIDNSGGDHYPLDSTIDNYQVKFLFLQPDGKISQNDTILTEEILIESNESEFWQTYENTVSEIDFSQPQNISGQIYTETSYGHWKILKKNDLLIVSLGYKDTSDSFVSITDPIILTGDGDTLRFDFQTTTKTISSGLNGPLVIKIENPNDYSIHIVTGSRWSFISMGAISGKIPEPKNDEYIISSGGTLSIEAPGILENDFNPEDTQLTATLKNTTKYGSLTLNADGSFTYVHNGSSSATSDQFTYTINNGYEDSIRTAQVSIQIIHAPVITLSPNQNVTNSNMTITIAGNSGSTIEYSLNDGNWQTYSEPIVLSNEGNYEITARLEDQNQEWLVSQPVSFIIDKTPPEPPILNSTSPQTNKQTSVNEIEVTWLTPEDLLSGILGYSYLLDNNYDSLPDNIIETQMLSFTSQRLEDSSYYFHVCAVDSANNISSPLHIGPFIVGPKPPPPTPKNLKVVKKMDATVKLAWDYINYDNISYRVYRSEMSGGLYYRVDTSEHGFYSINNEKVYYTDKNLINGQTYNYTVTSFWNNMESDSPNSVIAIPEQSFNFKCNTIDFDSQATWHVSKKVNVKGNVEYHFLIDKDDKFKGEIEASCNEMPDHVSHSFSLNKINYGASMHGITLPASFVLSITPGSAAVPGEYQFELSLKNVWEDGCADFMDIPLMLTITEENVAGILMDISKQPEPALFDIKKRNSSNENHDIQNLRNRTTETITYRMNQNEAVEIYGEIYPPSAGKTVTVQLECKNNDFKISTTLTTNAEGKFSLANWLSEFDINEYTLTARWTDVSTTTHGSNPRTIIIEKGKPFLTCNNRSNITPQLNENFSISGAIHPAKPGTHLYLLVISPENEMYKHDLVLDEYGEYSKTHAFFDRRGIWKVKAYWFGDDTHIGCESPFLIVPVDTSAGRGIILGGGEANIHNAEFDLVKRLTTEAYKDFKSRGFSDDMIYYAINSQIIDITDNEIPDNIVDNSLPSADSFLSAIENEFTNEVNEEVLLFIYMYGHGTDDGRFVVLGYDEVIEANQLDQSLTNIQKKTDCVVILIIESCYSGSFIKDVSGENRIILTSTDNKPYIHDSSGNITFSRYLFNHLLRNYSIKYSFDKAKEDLTNISYDPPLLDDNGDGISDQSDGALASNYYFKGSITWNFNVTIDENSIQMPYLVSNEKPVNVSAKVIRGDTATEAVWASIIPPDADLTGSDDLVSFQKIFLSYNSETQRYEGQLRYLCDAGLYKLVFMARQTNDAMSNPVVKYLTVEQSAAPKDIDGNGAVDLGDTILGLQVLSDFDVMMCRQPELSFGLDDLLILFQSIAD